MKTAKLLDAKTMLERLRKVNDNAHYEERFFPLLTKQAGRELNGLGVLMAVQLAIADYTDGMPALMANLMQYQVDAFCAALVDDAEVLADAVTAHKSILEEA
jgi:hypothetical protein